MKQRLSFVLITMFLALLGREGSLCAQSPRTVELGPYGGMSMTINDINTLKFFSENGYEYGGLIRYNHDTRWAFRIDASHSMVRSSDAVAQWRPERDKSFQSFVNEVSLIVEFTFLDFYTGRKGNSISPYLFGGGSAFTYKTAPLLNADEMVALAGDQLPANLRAFEQAWKGCLGKGNSYSIPFGFGCKVSLSEHLATNIEWKMNYTFTDAIDGLEDVYSDAHAFANVYCKDKKDSEGNLLKDKNGAQLKEYLVAFQPSAEGGYSFVSSYDLTDQTGLFGAEQQMSNSQSKDWLGSITISLTWKIPIPGGGACRVNHY